MSARTPTGRQPILDVVKAIAIWLVVLGHNETIRLEHEQWYRAIYLMHMPAFLIATGMVTPLMHDKGHLFDRMRALMQPFLVVWLLFLPLAWHRQQGDLLEIVGGLFWMNSYGLVNQPTWYLGVVACCLAWLWAWDRWPANAKLKAMLAVAMVVLACVVIPEGRRDEPWVPSVSASRVGWPLGLDLTLLILPLFLLGRHLRGASDRLGRDAPAAWCAFGVGVALFCVAFGQGAMLDLNARMLMAPAWCVLGALSGCLALWGLAGGACPLLRGRWLDGLVAVGRSTLFILLFHAPLQNAFAKLLAPLDLGGAGALLLSITVVIGLWWVDSRCVARVPILRTWLRPAPLYRR